MGLKVVKVKFTLEDFKMLTRQLPSGARFESIDNARPAAGKRLERLIREGEIRSFGLCNIILNSCGYYRYRMQSGNSYYRHDADGHELELSFINFNAYQIKEI